ncbi:MAG: helix-turn-helix domain-containing protein [Chitinophagales bacterium]|nr:helix-turn-helix domain-containing protein [Chitinophagales bacterium]
MRYRQSQLHRLENGKVDISLNRLEALSKIFKVPITGFFPASASQTIQITNGENSPNVNINNNVDPKLVEMLQSSLQILSDALRK